jgi:hypothetical protein
MTRRTVQALVAIVIGLVLLLVVLQRDDRDDAVMGSRLLLPSVRDAANDVDEITIARPGDDAATLQRVDDGWRIAERDGYPADVGRLRSLVVALAEARIVETKTANPDYYDRLGVGDPDDGGTGTKVTLDGPGFTHAVIIGDAARGEYRYARIPGEAASYLVDRNPDLPADPGGWLAPDIVDIDSGDVRRVTITHADGGTIVIEKTDATQTDFDVVGVPAGRQLSYPTVGNGVAGALSDLQLDDVRRRAESAAASAAVFETWDGLTVTVTVSVAGDGDEAWLAFEAGAAGEDPGVAATADGINTRTAGWQYRVPDYKKNLLTRRWEDMLRSPEGG